MIYLQKTHLSLLVIILPFLLALACRGLATPVPTMDPHAIQMAIEQTLAAAPTASIPTTEPVLTPQATNTPRPTNTARPSPTPEVGIFRFPLNIGDSIRLPGIPEEFRSNPSRTGGEVEFQLLEVKRGQDAKAQAQSYLDQFLYQEPMNGQEYVAIRGFLRMHSYIDNNQATLLYPYWHLTLRHEDAGSDIWSVDPILSIAEGYAPLEGEFWIFFLIREHSQPLLYFQPFLITMEQSGIRTSGAYYDIFGHP